VEEKLFYHGVAIPEKILANYLESITTDTLKEVMQGGGKRDPNPYVGVVFAVAAYTLYRLAKNYFDKQRGLDEAELRTKMLDQIQKLVDNDLSHSEAVKIVEKVSKDIATLRSDNSIITFILAWIRGRSGNSKH
jgi:hypothetical protein